MNTNIGTEKIALAMKTTEYAGEQTYVQNEAYFEVDVLKQLHANINQLEELHARLHFMMSEVSYLLKKS